MFYVYVLKSEKDAKLYIGFTGNLRKRFAEHNKGLVQSTRPRIPFSLVYYEAYTTEGDAKEREIALKRFSGSMTHLRKRLRRSLIISK
ncbi:MAG: GIY-YIG nuclease family protein [Patescibacteria group bacterium]